MTHPAGDPMGVPSGHGWQSRRGMVVSLLAHATVAIVLASMAKSPPVGEATRKVLEVAEFRFTEPEAPISATARSTDRDSAIPPAPDGPVTRGPERNRPAAPPPPADAGTGTARDVADGIDPSAPATDADSGARVGTPGGMPGGVDGGMAGGVPGGTPGGRGTADGTAGGIAGADGASGSRELWTEYGAVLQQACEKYRHYPPMARARGWQGDVEVRIQRDADGTVALSTPRGSGRAVLDDAALDIVRRAMADLPIPPKFRNRPLVLQVVIQFRLDP